MDNHEIAAASRIGIALVQAGRWPEERDEALRDVFGDSALRMELAEAHATSAAWTYQDALMIQQQHQGEDDDDDENTNDFE